MSSERQPPLSCLQHGLSAVPSQALWHLISRILHDHQALQENCSSCVLGVALSFQSERSGDQSQPSSRLDWYSSLENQSKRIATCEEQSEYTKTETFQGAGQACTVTVHTLTVSSSTRRARWTVIVQAVRVHCDNDSAERTVTVIVTVTVDSHSLHCHCPSSSASGR